jgi:predicted CopG family antitoxin
MVKTITIRDEVYGKLLTIKGKDESFSEALKNLRSKVEFTDKETMLSELYSKRAEKRN